MKSVELKAWQDKNLRLNANVQPHIGMQVKDENGMSGVVVKIRAPSDEDDHGTMYVWQCDRVEYGSDNCEHYAVTNWHSFLRVQT